MSRKAKYIKYLQIKEEIDYEAKHDGNSDGIGNEHGYVGGGT